MTRLLTILALVAALLLPSSGYAAADWNRVVVATPEGGWRIGNPAAPLKLVEYASLTCPHCAHFAADGWPQLRKGPIAAGRVSLELRQLVLNSSDLAAGMVVRCSPPATAVRLADALFANQPAAFGNGLDDAQAAAVEKLPPERQFVEIARLTPLGGFLAGQGVPQARAEACLADLKQRDRILAIRKTATDMYRINGTPSFLLNGKRIEGVYDWASLAPHLK